MTFRYLLTALLLVSVLFPFINAQPTHPTVEPGIHDFKFVDQEAYPINLTEIKRQIGYPIRALKSNIEGKVMCRILVDKYGKYQKHTITRKCHPILVNAVEAHIGNLHFAPAILGGEQTDYWLNVLFEFDLRSHPLKGLNKLSTKSHVKGTLNTNHRKAERFLSKAKSFYTAQNFVHARRMAWSSIHLNPFKRKKTCVSKEVLMEAWTVYGRCEGKLGNHEFSAKAYTEAIAIGEEISQELTHTQSILIDLYLYRSLERMALKHYEDATRDLFWVMSRTSDPQIQAKALLMRSVISTELQAYDQALNDAEKALDLNPYYCKAAWQKAKLLSQIGAKGEACNILHAYPPVYEEEITYWKEIAQESCVSDAAKN